MNYNEVLDRHARRTDPRSGDPRGAVRSHGPLPSRHARFGEPGEDARAAGRGRQPLRGHDLARGLRQVVATRGSRRRVGRARRPHGVGLARAQRLRRRRLVRRRTRTPWPAPRSTRRDVWRRGRSPVSCRRTWTSTGPKGWDRRTSKSSRWPKRAVRSTRPYMATDGDAFGRRDDGQRRRTLRRTALGAGPGGLRARGARARTSSPRCARASSSDGGVTSMTTRR